MFTLFVGGLMSCLRCLCLFTLFVFLYVVCVSLRVVVCGTYCVGFFFLFVLCIICCQFLWIVHF